MGVSLRFRFVLLLGSYVTEEESMEVAEYSKVLNIPNDFLEWDFRERCKNIIPCPENGNIILLIEVLYQLVSCWLVFRVF